LLALGFALFTEGLPQPRSSAAGSFQLATKKGEDMKLLKYLFALVIAFCAITSVSHAQATARLVGGGSSALFNELGSASQAIAGISCIWTSGKTSNIVARDSRFGSSFDEQGNFWVAWGPGTGSCAAPAGSFDVYSYEQLDSVVGDRCFFMVDSGGISGCTQIFNITAGAGGANKIPGLTDTAIPGSVITAIQNLRYNWAGTDVRPEDAKFATVRMFAPCNALLARQFFNQDSYFTFGLGYASGTPRVGVDIQEDPSAGTSVFHVLDFNIFGNDPQTNQAVPAYQTYSIGAQPIIVGVAPASDTAGIAGATDINGFSLTLFFQGILGRTTDMFGPTTTKAVDVYVREPLSGTYNTFEYSIPNGTQYHASQDYANCNGSGTVAQNPMGTGASTGFNIGVPSIGGVTPGRHRAIGTGHMVAAINAGTSSNNRMGYFFWSAGNASGLNNVKYLKVNGIDPLQDTYTSNGILPGGGGTGDPGIGANITFSGLKAGNYPIWSVLRLVGPPSNASIGNMLTALNTITGSQHDFVPLSSLKVWHSHFFLNGIGMTPAQAATGNTVSSANDLCTGSVAEGGGDAGGSVILFQANKDFCSDFSVTSGLLNKTQ
jgi:hypothetical protein